MQVILFYELMLFELATLLSVYIKQKNPARFENEFPYIKDYCITERANPISCAVGLR